MAIVTTSHGQLSASNKLSSLTTMAPEQELTTVSSIFGVMAANKTAPDQKVWLSKKHRKGRVSSLTMTGMGKFRRWILTVKPFFVFIFFEHRKGSSMTTMGEVEISMANFQMPSDLNRLATATITAFGLPNLRKLAFRYGHTSLSMAVVGLLNRQPRLQRQQLVHGYEWRWLTSNLQLPPHERQPQKWRRGWDARQWSPKTRR